MQARRRVGERGGGGVGGAGGVGIQMKKRQRQARRQGQPAMLDKLLASRNDSIREERGKGRGGGSRTATTTATESASRRRSKRNETKGAQRAEKTQLNFCNYS